MTVISSPCHWPVELNRRFCIVVCDWDGTAVENRRQDASSVRRRIDDLLGLGVWFVIVSGTNVGNIDDQFSSAIRGRQKSRLFLCTNRGSEVWTWSQHGELTRAYLRAATAHEEQSLTRAADDLRDWLVSRTGLTIRVIHDRLNRRKVDLIPLPEWDDPPKSAIGELRAATEARLRNGGVSGGLSEALDYAREAARRAGLPAARLTSDAKHIEIGLTDKSDSMNWVIRALAEPQGIVPRDILVAGDEFGEVAASPGSDSLMMTPSASGAIFVSVGPEPYGVPTGVTHLKGGPTRFLELLDQQIELWRSERAAS